MIRGDAAEKILKDISLKEMLDKRVVREVAYHPILFTKRIMESGDLRAVRVPYWGLYAPKKSKLRAMEVTAEYLKDNINDVYKVLPDELIKEFDGERELEEAIDDALEERNKPFLDKILKIYKNGL